MPINSAEQSVSTLYSAARSHNYTKALTTLAVLYFTLGFITCLNDTLVPFFKKGFTLNYSQSSLVQFYFFLTYAVMSVPAGKIVQRIGFKNGMVAGFSVAAIGAALFFPASILHEYYLFLAALFVVAIGIVLLQVAANPYITALGPARTASSRLTLIPGVGSVGTTVAPIFGAYFILSPLQSSNSPSEAVRIPYLAIAGLLLLIAIFVSRLALPPVKTDTSVSSAADKKPVTIFSFRQLNFGVIAIFMYVGAEVAIGTFLTNYISDILHISVTHANRYVAFYWGSMLVARLLGSYILKRVRPPVVLTITAIVAVGLIFISTHATGMLAVWSMIAVGLCNSIMFATIFSLSVNGLKQYSTQASGFLSTAIVGGAIVPYAQGVLKDHYDWQLGFLLPIICYLYIVFYGLNGHKSKFSEE